MRAEACARRCDGVRRFAMRTLSVAVSFRVAAADLKDDLTACVDGTRWGADTHLDDDAWRARVLTSQMLIVRVPD